jgi:tRNA-dihydrouridine synthase 3
MASTSNDDVKIQQQETTEYVKGVAAIKKEYLLPILLEESNNEKKRTIEQQQENDAESSKTEEPESKRRKKNRGNNKHRTKANQTSHLKQQNEETTAAVEEDTKPLQEGEMNKLATAVLRSLRKKEYDFTKALEVTKHVENYVKEDVLRVDRTQNANYQMLKMRLTQAKQEEIVAREANREPTFTTEQVLNSASESDRRLLQLTYVETKYKPKEVRKIDFKGKTYLAPLTTVGNLPFRRICKGFGVDITCGEMAMAVNILKGQNGELSLLKRHESEKIFGVQLAGGYTELMTKVAQVIEEQFPDIDFVDLNCGCPIDLLCNQGMGSGILEKKGKLQGVVRGMKEILSIPLTVKTRIGVRDNKPIAHKLFPQIKSWGADAVTLHGRSKQQRYTREADWKYIANCAKQVRDENLQVIGNGDIMTYTEYYEHINDVDAILIGRGALIKPWLFTEIKEQRDWDISANERLEMLKEFVKFGYDHYGADEYGVNTTRRYLLEWLSFLHRYIPVGILERTQKINERPPRFFCRNDLETLMASNKVEDWIKISELIMPKAPDSFTFVPKHKTNSYEG